MALKDVAASVNPSLMEQDLVASIEFGNIEQPETFALFRAGHELMNTRVVDRAQSTLTTEMLSGANISLLIAKIDSVAVGCCAVILKGYHAELKKMYVSPEARGKGVASRLIRYAEQVAFDNSCKTLRLESARVLANAHELYRRHGFQYRPAFRDHKDDGRSVFMEKAI